MYCFPYKQSYFYYGILIYAFIPSITLIGMNNPSPKKASTITLQLNNDSQYEIAKWKVKKESNTLCNLYYSQHTYDKHTNISLILPHISLEEITLFDQALDKEIDKEGSNSFSVYYDGLSPLQKQTLITVAGQHDANGNSKLCALRLTAQLAGKLLPHHLVKTNIINTCIPELPSLNMHLKSSIMIENIQKNLITPSTVSSYDPDNCFTKYLPGGAPLCIPKLENIDLDNFNGEPSPLFTKDSDGKEYNVMLSCENHYITTRNLKQLHLAQNTSVVKTITHPSIIQRASLSFDGKWLVALSSAQDGKQNSKLELTNIDISSQDYLSDITIVSEWNFNTAPCFNHASTLLTFGEPQTLTFFSLQTKKVVATLDLPTTKRSNPYPLEFAFNHDDTRLIGCLHYPDTEEDKLDKLIFMIWDTTNLTAIKELKRIELDAIEPDDATIIFNYPMQDTVAISTDYETFFFDVQSGAFLGKTKKKQDDTYAAACSIRYTPITCIAKNINDEASCIKVYNHRSGAHLGTISVGGTDIAGLGMTKNARSLVVTFDDYKSQTIELLFTQENAPILELSKSMSLIDFYGLLEIYRSKKAHKKAFISLPFLQYLRQFAAKGVYKDILEKYLY